MPVNRETSGDEPERAGHRARGLRARTGQQSLALAALLLAAACASPEINYIDDFDAGVDNRVDGGPSDAGVRDAGPPDAGTSIFGDPGVTLLATPPGLGFDCIAPGCHQTKTVRLIGGGPGPVRVFAVQMELSTSPDYVLNPTRPPPYDLAEAGTQDISVTYNPSDAELDSGAMLIDYGTPTSLVRGRLRVELLARSIGTAKVDVSPASLSFGYVPMGLVGMLTIRVKNIGTGNAPLQVTELKVLAGGQFRAVPEIRFDPDGGADGGNTPTVIATNEEKVFTVQYLPSTRGVHTDKLIIKTSDVVTPRIEVPLRGTAVEGPSAVLMPPGPVALGDVRINQNKRQTFELSNQGGQPLTVSSIQLAGAGAAMIQLDPPPSMLGAIAPFEAVTFTATYAPTATGVHDTTMTLTTNDPVTPTMVVQLTARGIDPRIAANPATVAYGNVVNTWVRGPTSIAISNTGFGPLQIQRVFLAPGSSTEVVLGTLPGLPITLNQGNHVDFEITYTSVTLSNVTARLLIESDDARTPVLEVPITARGVTCEEGCPLAHATPRCESGTCAIGVCQAGYVNADGQLANGCECQIEAPENPNLCAGARFLGTVSDDGESRTVSGQLHSKEDIDFFSAFASDDFQFLSDDFDVRITLSGPPGYKLCVFKAKRSSHEDVCPGNGDSPCSGSTSYRDEAGWASPGNDSSDYFIKVYNDGSGPTCGRYTLTVRNG